MAYFVEVCEVNLLKKDARYQKMTTAPVAKTILELSIPNTLGLLVIAAYSLADSFFVSELGTAAGAAIGVVFPLPVLIQAVGYTLGLGAGSRLSRALGKKETETASTLAASAILWSLILGCGISALGLWKEEALLRFFGASDEVMPLSLAYLTPLLWAVPFLCVTFVLSQLLRAEGLATYSMIGLSAGSICNIVLDPILISKVGMGIAGASTATLISQIVSALILFSAYLFRKSALQPFANLRIRTLLYFGKICVTGLPSLFRQGLAGVATILINHAARAYSDAAVLALSLVARVFLLVFSLCLGIGQGMMPVVGYSHGAGNEKRQQNAYRFAVRLSSVAMLVISIPLIIWAPEVISLFRDDSEVIQIGAFALRAQCAILFTHGLVTCTILYLQAVGRAFLGTFLAAARQGFFFLPLVFLLPAKFGLLGLCIAQPAADAVTFLFAWVIRKIKIKKQVTKATCLNVS